MYEITTTATITIPIIGAIVKKVLAWLAIPVVELTLLLYRAQSYVEDPVAGVVIDVDKVAYRL